MTFTMNRFSECVADFLAPFFPGTVFYASQNQQGTTPPCFFAQQRFASVKEHLSDTIFRKIGVDLIYLLDYNLPDLQTRYQDAADILDYRLSLIPYEDNGETMIIHALNREWTIAMDELHYKFEFDLWCWFREETRKMEVMEYEQQIRD